jgi:hypothetical protein
VQGFIVLEANFEQIIITLHQNGLNLSACFKSVKDVGNYAFCPDEKEAKPKS